MNASTLDCSPTGRVVIADTGAIITGVIRYMPGVIYAPSNVLDEVRDEASKRVLEEAIQAGRLRPVRAISSTSLKEALDAARRAGTIGKLSEVDMQVIGLAVEARKKGCSPIVATDDYALQYTLKKIGIPYTGVRYRGVR